MLLNVIRAFGLMVQSTSPEDVSLPTEERGGRLLTSRRESQESFVVRRLVPKKRRFH
jgi:hypothetical protein